MESKAIITNYSREHSIEFLAKTHTELHTLIFKARNDGNSEILKQEIARCINQLALAIAYY